MAKLSVSLEGVQILDLRPLAKGVRVVFLCRDPGGWSTLAPVMAAMAAEGWAHPFLAVSGWSLKELQAGRLLIVGTPCEDAFADLKPDVVVTAGSWSDHHLEIAARELFAGVPMVYVENNYQQYGGLFGKLQELGLALPDVACCIQEKSREDLVAAYPQYADLRKGWVTGTPHFYKAYCNLNKYPEDFQDFSGAFNRASPSSAPLVTFVGTPDVSGLVRAWVEALVNCGCTWPVYTVRPHPRDVVRQAEYVAIFSRAGLVYADTGNFCNETVMRHSAVVLSTWSTELVHAALYKRPAVYVVDREYLGEKIRQDKLRFPLPPARMDAALHCDTVVQAALATRSLSRPDSLLCDSFRDQYVLRKQFGRNPVPAIIEAITDASWLARRVPAL